jgi:replicative DNA helicase
MDNHFSQSAEEALLGAILINPGELREIEIEPSDFYIQRNRWIFEAIRSIPEPDIITLSDKLTISGHFQEAGGLAYLTQLIGNTPSSLDAGKYAEVIKQHAKRRRIMQAANDLAKCASSEDDKIDEGIANIVDTLTMGIRPKIGAVPWSVFLSQVFDEVDERSKNPKDIWGLSTGFKDFDTATGGLQPGEVLYVGGEPGIGKSILSMQMAVNLGKAGYPGAIYSLEMRGNQVGRRALSSIAKIETRHLKTGRLEDDEWPRFTAAFEEASQYPINLCDDAYLTTGALRADLARLKARYNIQWFVLDYLFLMADGDGRMDDNQRTAYLSRHIKSICSEFNVSGITVNSVTKDGMGNDARPSQKNIRGSGQVIHDADLILFLTNHIPSQNETLNKSLRTCTFGKGRELENSSGYFHLVKFDKWPAFGDYSSIPATQEPLKQEPLFKDKAKPKPNRMPYADLDYSGNEDLEL